MIFQVEGVHVARGGRYRPATRAELYVQARELGLAGCSRMRKHELARAVARARSRPAALRAAARRYREEAAAVVGRTVAVLLATFGRLRGVERLAVPVAAVVLAAGVGASMPVLIAAGTPEGAAALKVVTPVPASQASPDLGRPLESSQGPARPAGEASSPTGTLNATLVVAAGGGSSAGAGGPAEAPVASPEGGAPEPSGGSAPQAPAGAEPDVEEPTPEPTPEPNVPAPAPPVGGGAEEEEPSGEKATVCHKAGSKNAKTVEVGADAADEHLGHGDTLGACP